MLRKHPAEYIKYGCYIHDIISKPDYVGINPGDGSIEYVKDFPAEGNFVKVAVRAANSGEYFVRSVYVLSSSKVQRYIFNGTLKPLTSAQA